MKGYDPMNRRYAVAAVATVMIGLLAAPAEAGGGLPTFTSGAVGVKKPSNVRIRNTSTRAYYVVILPDSLVGSSDFGTVLTVGWARKLGGVLVNPGASVLYPVPAGRGNISIFVPSSISANSNDFLPLDEAGTTYNVAGGSTVTRTIFPGPVIN